ncbi:MAG TPA: winged helix-turn-helix domain-containing protein [Lysobacter sp.]|nr:winged helix-turn-helix domain-containing protein [Lysobacter sp.]
MTPKVISVLLALADEAGRPVSRETLLSRVWSNTLPTGDVVTQAIVQLRKVLNDSSQNAYIETVPKSGYRLLVPVEWLDFEQPAAWAATSAIASGISAPAHAVATATANLSSPGSLARVCLLPVLYGAVLTALLCFSFQLGG